jgi:hypothetical protein
LQTRYGAIAHVEQELAKAQAALADTHRNQAKLDAEAQERRATLNQQYIHAQTVYQNLQKEIALYENNPEDISFGIYKPQFTFDTPEKYKQEMEQYRNLARDLVRKGKAAVCSINWTTNNSKSEGNRMAKQYEKLVLGHSMGNVKQLSRMSHGTPPPEWKSGSAGRSKQLIS